MERTGEAPVGLWAPHYGSAEAALPTEQDQKFSDDAQELISESWSPHTRRAFKRHWEEFTGWCERQGRTPLPATAQTVSSYAAYLVRERGLAPPSVKQAVQALKSVHGVAGHPLSTDWAAKVTRSHTKEWVQAGNREKQAPALTLAELKAMLEVAQGRSGLRDRVVLLLGITGMFRRSELAGLVITDLRFVEQGLEVYLGMSKTDQEAKGALVEIPFWASEDACPVRAVQGWLKELAGAGVTEGPLLRRVHKDGRILHGLQPKAVNEIVQRLARRAGVEGVSAHSLRAGGATLLDTMGVPLAFIKEQGRWKSDVVHQYVRRRPWEDNPMKGIGL